VSFANLLEHTCPLIFFLPTSSSRVLPSSTIRFSSKVAARRRSLSTTCQRRTVGHMLTRDTGSAECRLYSRQSRRHQRLSCFESPVLSFSSRAVTKENPHQPTPLHTVVDNSTTVATIERRGRTEYPYGTSELSPSFVNDSRNDLLVLTLLFGN
jgi:hypothetical protein